MCYMSSHKCKSHLSGKTLNILVLLAPERAPVPWRRQEHISNGIYRIYQDQVGLTRSIIPLLVASGSRHPTQYPISCFPSHIFGASITFNVLVVRFTSGSGKFLRTRTPNLTNIRDGSERERDPTFSSRSGTLAPVRVRFAFER